MWCSITSRSSFFLQVAWQVSLYQWCEIFQWWTESEVLQFSHRWCSLAPIKRAMYKGSVLFLHPSLKFSSFHCWRTYAQWRTSVPHPGATCYLQEPTLVSICFPALDKSMCCIIPILKLWTDQQLSVCLTIDDYIWIIRKRKRYFFSFEIFGVVTSRHVCVNCFLIFYTT